MRRREIAKALLLGAGIGTGASRAADQADQPRSVSHPLTDAEREAKIRAVRDAYPPGDIRRYKGADDRDFTHAIQRALDARESVFVPRGKYHISSTLRFKSEGQILRGEGISQSTIEYGGPPEGKVASVSDGTINYSQCTIADLTLDGGRLANVGIEGYDDRVPGGSWRTRIARVAVVGATYGEDATAVRLGTGHWPNFAHDTRIDDCFLQGSIHGVWGAGANYALSQTTLFQMSGAACRAQRGSAWTFSQCVFSQNGWDFDGSGIQHADFSGCWFEDSTGGIYRAAEAHSVSLTGCYLHTANREHMMDFGSAAGYHFIGGHFIPTSTKSLAVVNVNPTAIGSVSGQPVRLTYAGGAEASLAMPAIQPGSGSVRSVAAHLTSGQRLVLALGRGVFFVGASISGAASPAQRAQASYTAFLFDGNHEDVELIASRAGGGGGLLFSLRPSGNSVTLTYTGPDSVVAYLSGVGTAG